MKTQVLCGTALMIVAGCSQTEQSHNHGHEHVVQTGASFSQAALLKPAETVSCLLENGDTAECLEITVKHKPDDLTVGPFCPATLQNAGGVWAWTGASPGLYRVDQAFLEMLSEQGYRMFDEDGNVYISDISEAQPVEDHTCIQVSEDDGVEITALIPLHPVMADAPAQLGVVNKIGMALNGTPIFSDAPSVQHTGHMPALDTCGGHVDPGGWYHWHANSSDIETVYKATGVEADCAINQNAAQQFGYAFDGFPIYGSLEASGEIPSDLDECNGHIGEMSNGETGYHYHTSDAFPNLPKCLVGVQAVNNFNTTAQVGIGANPAEGIEITRGNPPGGGGPNPGGRQPPNLDEAAAKLGVPVQTLSDALRQSGRPPDFAQVAERLGVSEQELREAIPPRPGR